MSQTFEIEVEQRVVRISNPEKILWPDLKLTKMHFIRYLIEMSAYLLPYVQNRLLTTIRFPHGIGEPSFYQKNVPSYAPNWIATYEWKGTTYILLNDLPTLVWLGNQACLEYHVPFNFFNESHIPSEIVFDLDPSDADNFNLVLEVALLLKEVLDSLGLVSQAKTSGATGMQIYIPIERRYTYEQTYPFNQFIAHYMAEKYPQSITLERFVKNRGKKLYFDYLQHGEGKTLAAPYFPRARKTGTVSTPVSWEEVRDGFHPHDFTMETIVERVKEKGDLFAPITTDRQEQSLDGLLEEINVFVNS